ncbi:MAG: FAD-dependent monooxygenase [Pseudomonadota bacterium]
MDKVLVVGGRTTGLMMALELARRGIPTRCIDKSPGIDPHVRANLLHSRSLEIFQSLGIAEQVTKGSIEEKGYVFYRDRELIGECLHSPIDSPFPYGLSQSQAHVEATLEKSLNSLNIKVERQVSLTSIDQDSNGLSVCMQHYDGSEEISRHQWLVACDGAHSTVRHLAGVNFPGEGDDVEYILGDIVMTGDKELEGCKGHVFFHDNGELFVFTRLPGNRQFIVATLQGGTSLDREPTLEDLQSIVSERAGSYNLSDPQWLGRFKINYRIASQYRTDRIFLAGDAAHVHSLLAGIGMNTGIQDAYNLGWKLALVASHQASVDILDTYEEERKFIAEDVLNMTHGITDTMESYPGLTQGERDKLISHLFVPEAERLNAARHLQEVDIDYSKSKISLVTDDTFSGGPAAGSQAPDAEGLIVAGDTTSYFRLPADKQFRLLLFCNDINEPLSVLVKQALDKSMRFATWLKPYIIVLEQNQAFTDFEKDYAVVIDQQGLMHQKYAAHSSCIYLIRPDGYVAYRSFEIKSVYKYFDHLEYALA